MARSIDDKDVEAIIAALRFCPGGAGSRRILELMPDPPPIRTLQHRLRVLVEAGRLAKRGSGPRTTYDFAASTGGQNHAAGLEDSIDGLKLSAISRDMMVYLNKPMVGRKHVGYHREFLDDYKPGKTRYLTDEQCEQLREVGQQMPLQQPAGTYARSILSRFLIDLAWNSSRLEGNTYSILEARRLIEFGQEADKGERSEAQMILNHKEAIEMLVDSADSISFDRHTILNLHALLANNLMEDSSAPGRLRSREVVIGGSVYQPLSVPQIIEECFDAILEKASAVENPYEQALFVMVQMPYLQPFEDVNKRVSRLAASIPLIRANLIPLSFIEVDHDWYVRAVLGVYEMNQIDLLRDLFIWAYCRSAERCKVIKNVIGDPDPFKFRYNDDLRTVVGDIVRRRMTRIKATRFVHDWAKENVPSPDVEKFREVAEDIILSLHEYSISRFRLQPSQYAAWEKVWNPDS